MWNRYIYLLFFFLRIACILTMGIAIAINRFIRFCLKNDHKNIRSRKIIYNLATNTRFSICLTLDDDTNDRIAKKNISDDNEKKKQKKCSRNNRMQNHFLLLTFVFISFIFFSGVNDRIYLNMNKNNVVKVEKKIKSKGIKSQCRVDIDEISCLLFCYSFFIRNNIMCYFH